MLFQQKIKSSVIVLTALWFGKCDGNSNSEIAKILNRPVRSLAFPDFSTMGIFLALAVPLDEPEYSVSMSYFFAASYSVPTNFSTYYDGFRRRRSIDRSTVYQVLENKFESAGYPGRECLLRSICETSEWPLRHNGILGDIVHVILTPSTSRKEDIPEEFSEAERVGRNGTCIKSYPLCPMSLFEMIGIFVSP